MGAENRWQGSGSVGNWDTVGNWSLGAKPVNTDNVIFPEGTGPVTTGHTDETAVTLDKMILLPGYQSAIGASGSRLTISATEIFHFGSGKLWFTDSTGVTDKVLVNGLANADLMDIDGTIVTLLAVLSGTVTVGGTAGAIARVEVGYRGARSSDAKLVVSVGAGAFTDLHLWGGQAFCHNAVTTATIRGGELIKRTTAITTANLEEGGRLSYETTGTITTLRMFPGCIADFTKATGAVTVTNLFRYPGATLIENKAIGAPTVTNLFDYRFPGSS